MAKRWKELSHLEKAEYDLLAKEEWKIYEQRLEKYEAYLKMQPEQVKTQILPPINNSDYNYKLKYSLNKQDILRGNEKTETPVVKVEKKKEFQIVLPESHGPIRCSRFFTNLLTQ